MRRLLAQTLFAVCIGSVGTQASAASYRIVYAFKGGSDGSAPTAGLTEVGGRLYGTTASGGGTGCGGSGCGTVFSVAPIVGVEKIVYAFSGGSDGAYPTGGLVNVLGQLYGNVTHSGNSYYGGVFAVAPATAAERTVVTFTNRASNGATPMGSLLEFGGVLYGTTELGGATGPGTVFSVLPKTGAESIVYSFQDGGDGANPKRGLIRVGPLLFGVTPYGGSTNGGTVYSVDPKSGKDKVLYVFQGGNNGYSPIGGLASGNGQLYGTTQLGGDLACGGGGYGCGTVFSVNAATGAQTVLHAFESGNDGANPVDALVLSGKTLYGTTPSGGGTGCAGYGCGTVFSIDLATGFTRILHAFQGGLDGASPGGLTLIGGTLYGTTGEGGVQGCGDFGLGCGTVFALTP